MSNNLIYNLTYVGKQFYLNKSVYTSGLMVLNRFLGSHMKQYVKYIWRVWNQMSNIFDAVFQKCQISIFIKKTEFSKQERSYWKPWFSPAGAFCVNLVMIFWIFADFTPEKGFSRSIMFRWLVRSQMTFFCNFLEFLDFRKGGDVRRGRS